jgi:Family of unknown function (DUF6263)
MKKIALLSLCFATLLANAQNVQLEKDKVFKVTVVTNKTSESPMGGEESKQEMTLVNTFKITAIEDKVYKATNTFTKMKMTGEMMGQTINFDSDKKEDLDSQIGQMLGSAINKSTEVTIDKKDGKVTEASVESLEKSMQALGETNANDNIFLVVDPSKKVGDKWTVTTDVDGIKTTKNYEFKSRNNDIVTLSFSATSKGTNSREMNGTSIESTIDNKDSGTILVNVKTSMIKEVNINSETSGSMEAMGQSIPLNGKSVTKVTIE